MGIARSTLYKWAGESKDISDAIKKTREVVNAEAEEALMSLFGGKYVEDINTDIWEENGQIVKRHIVKKKRFIPANVTAIIFFLKARVGWTENPVMEGKTGEILESLQKLMRGEE